MGPGFFISPCSQCARVKAVFIAMQLQKYPGLLNLNIISVLFGVFEMKIRELHFYLLTPYKLLCGRGHNNFGEPPSGNYIF